MNIKGNVSAEQTIKGTLKDIPFLDKTLTKEGYSADSKAVGDALNGKSPSTHTHTASDVGARPDTWLPSVSDIGAAHASHVTDKNNPHGVTPAQIGAFSNNGWSTAYATVLEAAMAMPKTGGSFFAVANTALLNASDAAFPGRETTYLMLTDETIVAARKTVLAIRYGSVKSIKQRTIWDGAWQNEWSNIATPDDIGAASLDYARSIGLPYLGAAADTATVTASNVDSVTAQGIYYTEMDSWCQTIVFNAGFGAMQMQFSWNGNIRTRINWGGNWSSWN